MFVSQSGTPFQPIPVKFLFPFLFNVEFYRDGGMVVDMELN